MKIKLMVAMLIGASCLVACDEGDKAKTEDPAAKASVGPEAAEAKDTDAKTQAAKAADDKVDDAKAEPKKLDKDGLESVADAVTFEQGDATDKGFSGKLENTSEHGISRLEYKAFAYDAEGKLLEMVEGKFPKTLDAGASAEIEVGPFEKAAGKEGVSIEVVVSWMNVDGTSYQRPVPKDRAKGGPNNALKK